MAFELDNYDLKIISLLQSNARSSYAEIGRQVHLTAPAVTERVRRLEEAGVITGFQTRVNLRALGYSFEAFINIVVDSHAALDAWSDAHPEVLALHATTGNYCALMHIGVTSPEHLKDVLMSLGKIGKTSTSMVLSSQFENRPRCHVDQLSKPS